MPASSDNTLLFKIAPAATELRLIVNKTEADSPVGVDLVSDEQGTTIIKRVKHGGPLAQAGALPNDVLLVVNGERVSGAKQAAEEFGAARAGSFEIVVQRAAAQQQRTASESECG